MQLKSYFQLYKIKECKKLTLTGWMILIIILLILTVLIGKNAYSFLAVSKPVVSNLLIIEGHVPDYALDSAKKIFTQNNDSLIFTTGVPMKQGRYLCGYSNYADLTAASLYRLGIDSSLIISVPSIPKQKDRTYGSALALKRQLKKMNITKGSFNILTSDTHARRTKYLFQKAMGENWKIGIISIHSTDYDTDKWWKSSFGVRAVIYESLAWIYAKFLFYPDNIDTNANRN
jgi:uncharacterized SAM-binding protein YcdF (DUF218 family)